MSEAKEKSYNIDLNKLLNRLKEHMIKLPILKAELFGVDDENPSIIERDCTHDVYYERVDPEKVAA